MVSILTQIFFSSAVFAGVLSGGGGSTVEVSTIDGVMFKNVVDASRAELILFFNAHQKMGKDPFGPNGMPEFAKLFPAGRTIVDVIKDTKIFLNTNFYLPCKDAKQNAVDASIHSPKPNTICLSEYRVQQKLSQGDARQQVLALLAHEYSHLMGLDEDEATRLQKAIYRIEKLESDDHVETRLYDLKVAFQKLRGAFINHKVLYANEPRTWNYYCDLLDKTQKYFEEIRSFEKLKNFSFGDIAESMSLRAYYLKNVALVNVACGNSDYKPQRKTMKDAYEAAFGSEQVISAEKWNQLLTVAPEPADSSIQFKKIESPVAIDSEIADLLPYIDAQDEKVRRLLKMKQETVTF